MADRETGEVQDPTKEVAMRKVVAVEFVSLDGVMEAPDQWHFPYWSDEMGQEIAAAMGQADAMLLGRVNYKSESPSGRSRTRRRTPSRSA
jgi:hypothetical protein